jgi:eukaryotic-like serine/threonine-protein kinase
VWKRWTESEEGYNTAGYQSFGDPDDFEGKLEACLRQWLERRGVVAKGPVWDRKLKGSPFRGLAAFEAAHAPVFFGREAAIARATAKLRQAPFLLVIGASGSGKSSLLRAGLVPRVTAPGVIPDIDLWRPAIITPSGDPLAALAEALFAADALGAELKAGDFTTPHLLAELLAAGGKAALAPIRTALARAAQTRKEALRYDAARPARLLLAVDQVERLFVEVAPGRVELFAALLRGLVEARLASVVAVLRSDAYGRFQAIEPFLALLDESGATLDLLPPSPSELEDIVTRPVAACHPPLAYETDAQGRSLAEILVADAKGGDALPLLQMTLQRLFDAEGKRGDGVLRFADYPGLDAAVARTAEEAVAGLDERSLAALPALITAFVRDVTVDPNGGLEALTIVPVARREFERGEPARRALIDEFVARRLLTAEEVDGSVRVRPVHEALLRVVPEVVVIIKEHAALIRVRRTLEPMAAEWSRAAAAVKSDFLATSPALIAGAAQLGERLGDDLSADMRAFIADSLAADARRRESERARQRRILMATAAGLVIALTLAGLAGWQWQVAKTQSRRAENALTAATGTADTLIFDLAQEFRKRAGMPVDLIRLILERVQELQRQLAQAGETTPDLQRLEAVALDELYSTFLAQGDSKAALAVAERQRDILAALVKAFPNEPRLQRELAITSTISVMCNLRSAENGKNRSSSIVRRSRSSKGLQPRCPTSPDSSATFHSVSTKSPACSRSAASTRRRCAPIGSRWTSSKRWPSRVRMIAICCPRGVSYTAGWRWCFRRPAKAQRQWPSTRPASSCAKISSPPTPTRASGNTTSTSASAEWASCGSPWGSVRKRAISSLGRSRSSTSLPPATRRMRRGRPTSSSAFPTWR